MPAEGRGRAIRVMVNLVNWQQEEPTGCGGGRQPSMDGTSRVTGDRHARFREGLGVKFPGPTRLVSRTRSSERGAVPEMKEDPSEPAYRRRLQTAVSCCRPM